MKLYLVVILTALLSQQTYAIESNSPSTVENLNETGKLDRLEKQVSTLKKIALIQQIRIKVMEKKIGALKKQMTVASDRYGFSDVQIAVLRALKKVQNDPRQFYKGVFGFSAIIREKGYALSVKFYIKNIDNQKIGLEFLCHKRYLRCIRRGTSWTDERFRKEYLPEANESEVIRNLSTKIISTLTKIDDDENYDSGLYAWKVNASENPVKLIIYTKKGTDLTKKKYFGCKTNDQLNLCFPTDNPN